MEGIARHLPSTRGIVGLDTHLSTHCGNRGQGPADPTKVAKIGYKPFRGQPRDLSLPWSLLNREETRGGSPGAEKARRGDQTCVLHAWRPRRWQVLTRSRQPRSFGFTFLVTCDQPRLHGDHDGDQDGDHVGDHVGGDHRDIVVRT